MHESGQECVQEGTYRPWIMVGRRKSGAKHQRNGGDPVVLDNSLMNQARGGHGYETRGSKDSEKLDLNHGPVRETKRKLSQPRPIKRAQVASVIKNIREETHQQAQPTSDMNQGPLTQQL